MERPLKEGYKIFHAKSLEDMGASLIAIDLEDQINRAMSEYNIEFLSNAKIDADPCGKNIYFGYQCCILRKRADVPVKVK
jgi:hypothetical protein